MDLDAVVYASPEPLASSVGDEVALLSLTRGTYYGLNRPGAGLWQRLQRPVRVRELYDELLQTYAVDADACRRDLLDFLEHLARSGLLEVRADAG